MNTFEFSGSLWDRCPSSNVTNLESYRCVSIILVDKTNKRLAIFQLTPSMWIWGQQSAFKGVLPWNDIY